MAPLQADVPSKTTDKTLTLMLRALRHRNYPLFFGGQSVSLIGTWKIIRQLVRPIYVGLGIIPEMAAGIQEASTLRTPPQE